MFWIYLLALINIILIYLYIRKTKDVSIITICAVEFIMVSVMANTLDNVSFGKSLLYGLIVILIFMIGIFLRAIYKKMF